MLLKNHLFGKKSPKIADIEWFSDLNTLYQMVEDILIQRTQGLEKKEPIYRDFRAGMLDTLRLI
jgi:hypothetical protein